MKETRVLTPAEAKEAERAAEANKNAGYDQTKGPDGKDTHKAKVVDAIPDDDIRNAIKDLVDGYKGKADRGQVLAVLRTAAEMLNRDTSWVRDPATLDYDPDDLDDPRANPLGARPAPKGATRADEHTQPEPDSLGNVADRKAAEAHLDDEMEYDESVPPADREAVAITRASQKAVDEFGVAGGTPLSRAEHKDDPKPKKK